MCGINCFISRQPNIEIQKVLLEMNNVITHRGPDQDGFFEDNSSDCKIGMAMRRLSIIDLSMGKQPIFSADNQKVIVFNGEIYNYKILKQDHLSEYNFKTSSDTEVIIALYEKYGVKSFSLLDGMFAFSIYDKTVNKIFIARDFFGEKPLYYIKNNDSFICASELKYIIKILPSKPPINKTALNLFLQLTYIPAPYTIYEDIHKLEANHYLEFNCMNFSYEIHTIEQTFKTYTKTTKEAATKITHDLVQESVVSRSIADVSLGTFLSGGVDSSIVSLCLSQQSNAKIETFSIGFDKKSFDETDKSRAVAKLINSNHHEFIISERDLTANIDEIILNFDEPFADSSALATYIVSIKTKQFVTVALTGDGGDEVFGGYNKYYMGRLNEKYTNHIPFSVHKSVAAVLGNLLHVKDDNRGNRFKINRLLKAINYEGDFYYNIISLGFQENEIKSVLKADYYNENPLSYFKSKIGDRNKTLTNFRNIDRLLSLEGDMLVKVDRTSMLTSLECRAPFLNKKLWNFANNLPDELLIKGFNKKFILKEAFKGYFPNDFLNSAKKGFGVPVGDWLRSSLRLELLAYTEKSFIEKQGIFELHEIEKLIDGHISGAIDNTFKVWTFFCFQKWYKSYFDN